MLGMRFLTAALVMAILSFNIGWKLNSAPTTSHMLVATTTQVTGGEVMYVVIRVVDGDTIVVAIDGIEEKVRLLGINTPETVDPRKTVECFGKQASQKIKNLLESRMVQLETDPSQGDKDKYGRLLRYVRRDDGLFVNKNLIEEGFAYEYTYRTPYEYQKEFKAAQKNAEKNEVGLWAPNACAK